MNPSRRLMIIGSLVFAILMFVLFITPRQAPITGHFLRIETNESLGTITNDYLVVRLVNSTKEPFVMHALFPHKLLTTPTGDVRFLMELYPKTTQDVYVCISSSSFNPHSPVHFYYIPAMQNLQMKVYAALNRLFRTDYMDFDTLQVPVPSPSASAVTTLFLDAGSAK